LHCLKAYPADRSDPPITHDANPEAICEELDYEDMIALSGMFRRWALYEAGIKPESRTQFILWSSDFERIAAWAGKG
jgi:hypothetical protein